MRAMGHPNELVKYPRTPHLPSSPGATSDDKYASAETLAYLASGIDLVVTEKFDGGNLTFGRGDKSFFARSLDSGTHSWDTKAKALWANIRWDIPEGWRISGESMYAQRSMAYENLEDIYLVFGIWDETNTLLDWDSTVEYATLLGLSTVSVLYRGNDFKQAVTAWGKQKDESSSEGFVVRSAGRIAYDDFSGNFAKWVRANHVTTDASWRGRDDWAVNGVKSKSVTAETF
jgi:hypothetical protein